MLSDNVNSPNAKRIWDRFEEISRIPRPSKGEEKIAKHIKELGENLKLKVETDEQNNVLIRVPATQGLENTPGVILQCHSDMVCVSDDENMNPSKAGVSPVISTDRKWVHAKGTTLGADNGIGVAVFLALLEEKDFKHGPLAVLVTTDEETGLNGAKNLKFDLKGYKYLVNGDSEEWGEATIACAGGVDSILNIAFTKTPISNEKCLEIALSGLTGGHSALAIAEVGLGNANKVLASLISDLVEEIEVRIIDFEGGTARNVIASSAKATIAYSSDSYLNILANKAFEKYKEILNEANMEIEIKEVVYEADALSIEDTQKLLDLINDIPHGVKVWYDEAKAEPQTSTNLAIVTTTHDGFMISNMSRSSVQIELDELTADIKSIADKHGATCTKENAYSGWEPRPDSTLVQKTKAVFKKKFGSDLVITQTHGGLECGIILGQYPELEAISIGPTIHGAHSVNEKVEIESVEKFYELTKHLVVSLI